jgi:HEAT repeat protein
MPSDSRRSRGLPLPTLGQWLTTALILCLAWFLWSEYELRSEVVDLSHPPADPVKYLQAIETVVEQGREGIPGLLVALSSDNTKARVYAIYALGRIGPQAREAVAPVCDRLRDENAGVREMAAVALRHLCPQPEDVAPLIVSLLDDADAGVRKAVMNELIELHGAARPTIIALLESERSTLRKEAVRILRAWRLAERHEVIANAGLAVRRMTADAELDVQGEARMALVEWELADAEDIHSLLHSGQAEQVEVGLKGLFSRRLDVHAFLPDLLALLENPQLESTPVAVSYAQHPWLPPLLELLMSMKGASRPAAPRLFRLLEVIDRDRVLIVRALPAIDADREEMILAFGSLVRDADFRAAREAAHLLIEISPEAARQHASMLIAELKEAEESTIPAIVGAIGHLGSEAGDAVPSLIPLLGSAHRSISEAAVSALGEIGPDAAPAARVLAELVARKAVDIDQAAKAAEAIGKIGPSARAALPVLLRILKQPEPAASQMMIVPGAGYDRAVRFRSAVIGAVGRMGIDTPDILAAMRLPMASRNPTFRAVALEGLASLSPNSLAVVHDLRAGLQDVDPDVRIYAAWALARMTADRDEVVAALIESLADDQPRVRTAAAFALGRIGPPARAALPALQDVLENDRRRSSVPQMQSYAMLTMMRTGPPPIPELRQLSLRQAVLGALAKIDPQEIEHEGPSATATRPGASRTTSEERAAQSPTIEPNPSAAPARGAKKRDRPTIFRQSRTSPTTAPGLLSASASQPWPCHLEAAI